VSFPLLVFTDAARSLILAACAVGIALPVVRRLATLSERVRPWAWALLLAPLLTPTLLVSYAYAPLALRAMAVPAGVSVLHFIALLLRLVPVGAVVLQFVPPLASRAALHCHALLAPTARMHRRFQFGAFGPGPWFAGGIVFLLAFADFELASLWSLKTWPVTLFDAHAGGLSLPESLYLAVWPLGLEAAVLFALSRLASPTAEGTWPPPGSTAGRLVASYFVLAGGIGSVLPLAIVAAQAIQGLPALAGHFILTREIAVSLAFALGAALCANALGYTSRSTWILAAPGLLGSLVLALAVLAVFHLPILRAAYDTPLPLLLTHTLFLLPLALLLRWRTAAAPDPALHVARLIGPPPRALLWRLDGRRRFTCFGLLFYWAYTEFTASSLLAPAGLTPVFARLHNLAHYGQTAVLSAMLLAAFLAPLAVLLLTAPIARFYPRRDGR
jgi:hypothetical protein